MEIRYYLRKVLFVSTGFLLRLVPKKKGLVLFTAWFGEKYIDNSKYFYEYLLDSKEYKPVWMTTNKEIYSLLNGEGKPVAFFNSIKGFILQIRAEAVVSSVQFVDYNCWLLTRCIFLDLSHGHPIKDPGSVVHDEYAIRVYSDIQKRVFYYAIVAGTKSKENYKVVNAPQDHIFVSDFVRNDVLIDKQLQKGKNNVVDEFKKGRKAIVYMPTHRSDGKQIMDIKNVLDLDSIEEYCTKNNFVFIIKKHFYHRNEIENLENYHHILDITAVDDIDPQVLLCQADILISDYSACYVDYMLLNRPIIFFQYDIDYFNNSERKLKYNFEELNIAPIVYEKDKLVDCIDDIIKNGDRWLDNRMEFAKENYFDNVDQKDGRARVKAIFDQLYQQYFK